MTDCELMIHYEISPIKDATASSSPVARPRRRTNLNALAGIDIAKNMKALTGKEVDIRCSQGRTRASAASPPSPGFVRRCKPLQEPLLQASGTGELQTTEAQSAQTAEGED